MGLGWEIGFGRLLPPSTPENRGSYFIYEAADGARVEFKQATTELPNVSFRAGEGAEQLYFSVNGSGSRLSVSELLGTATLSTAEGGRIEFRNIDTFVRRDGTVNYVCVEYLSDRPPQPCASMTSIAWSDFE